MTFPFNKIARLKFNKKYDDCTMEEKEVVQLIYNDSVYDAQHSLYIEEQEEDY